MNASRSAWTTSAVALLGASALLQLVYGIAALGGDAALKENVRRIEANPDFGTLYFSLGVWGVLLILIGAAELAATIALFRQSQHARLYALGACLFGLAVAFFTLAILRAAAVLPIVLLLAVLYVLSYRVSD